MSTTSSPTTSTTPPPSPPPLAPLGLRPGRRRDAVWQDTTIGEDGIVSCNKCNLVIGTQGLSHVERVRMHFRRRCTGGPRSSEITEFFRPAVAPLLEYAFQRKLAEWIYATGISFNCITNPLLGEALAMINPTLKAPTRHELAGRLLDQAYEASVAKVVAASTGKRCSLTTDGWTDVNGQPVINYVLVVGSATYFLESAYTGSTSHDTNFLANDVARVIEEHSYAKVCAVVTDNTAANRAMWAALEARLPRVFFHGCVSHTIHLLVKDIVTKLTWLSELAESCKTIIRFFKKHPLIGSELREEQDKAGVPRLALPGDTRWCSLEKAFVTVRKSDEILLRLVSSRDFLEVDRKKRLQRRQIQAWVQEPDFARRLDRGSEVLGVLSAYLCKFERNTTPISDVYAMFLLLNGIFEKMKLTATDRPHIERAITARFDFVYGDAHGVAYMLDPRFIGKGMDATTRQDVERFIGRWHGEEKEEDTILELAAYVATIRALEDGRSVKLALVKAKRLSVQAFWAGIDGFPLLQELALSVFANVCSSASAGRNFSSHKFVHSLVRNRLTGARVKKLVHLFFNAKNEDDETLQLLRDIEELRVVDEVDDTVAEESDFVYY